MKKIILLITFILATLLIISCSHEHTGGERCLSASVCEICGKQYGEPAGHLMGYATDATTHTYNCLRDNCTETGTRSAHFGGTATCAEKATCVECGEHYGNTLEHTLSQATCTERGKCTVCGAEAGKLLSCHISSPFTVIFLSFLWICPALFCLKPSSKNTETRK